MALYWYYTEGDNFKRQVEQMSEGSSYVSGLAAKALRRDRQEHEHRRQVERALIRSRADHFMLGVKQFRARRKKDALKLYFHRSKGLCKLPFWTGFHIIDLLWLKLLVYPYLVGIVSAVLFFFPAASELATSMGWEFKISKPSMIALIALCFALSAMNLVSVSTTVIGPFFERKFSLQFYGMPVGKSRASGTANAIQEPTLIAVSFLLLLLSNGTSVYFLSHVDLAYVDPAFNIFSPDGYSNFSNIMYEASKSFYFALTTMTTTGYGDVLPQNSIGYVYSAIMQIQALGLLVFAIARFWAK
jgi:hypothetical protein